MHIPANRDIRAQAEQRQLDLLKGNVDLVVLARYMQIITPDFLTEIVRMHPFRDFGPQAFLPLHPGILNPTSVGQECLKSVRC